MDFAVVFEFEALGSVKLRSLKPRAQWAPISQNCMVVVLQLPTAACRTQNVVLCGARWHLFHVGGSLNN